MYQKFVVPVAGIVIGAGLVSLLFVESLPLLAQGNPVAERLLDSYLLLAPWLIGAGVLLYLPFLVKQLQHFYATTKKVGWARALSAPRPRVAPWPRHTHPTAGKTSWSGGKKAGRTTTSN